MVHVLTGPVRWGKTTLLKKLSRRAIKQGVALQGFLSESVEEGGCVFGYDLFDLRLETKIPFLRRRGEAGWQRTGPYFMIPEALDRGSAIIYGAAPGCPLVVDEVGPLEIGGGGLWSALTETAFREDAWSLLVVRDGCLEDFLKRSGGGPVRVFSVRDPGAEEEVFRAFFIAGG